MPGDHQFFIRRNHPGRDLACRAWRSAGRLPALASVVEFDAEPRGSLADPPADLGEFSPMPAVKTSAVDAAQHRRQRADFLGRAVHEIVHGQARRRLVAREQIAHVVADARDAEQAGLLVENRLHFLRVEAQRLKEIQNHAGIERARPRPHAKPVQRRETERAVDALSALHRAQAGAAAQMRDDHAPSGDFRRDLRQHGGDVFVRQTVKSVALDAARRISRGSGTSSATAGWPR